MADLVVSGLDDALHEALRARAAREGLSVEAFVRALAEAAAREEVALFDRWRALRAEQSEESTDTVSLVRAFRDGGETLRDDKAA